MLDKVIDDFSASFEEVLRDKTKLSARDGSHRIGELLWVEDVITSLYQKGSLSSKN